MASGVAELPGSLVAEPVPIAFQGQGRDGGARAVCGGIGDGNGPGLGTGEDGGTEGLPRAGRRRQRSGAVQRPASLHGAGHAREASGGRRARRRRVVRRPRQRHSGRAISRSEAFGLDDRAVEAVKQWRLLPGRAAGVAVAVPIRVELTFTLLLDAGRLLLVLYRS